MPRQNGAASKQDLYSVGPPSTSKKVGANRARAPEVGATLPAYTSIQVAAIALDISTDHIRDLIARGELPAYRIGKGRGLIRLRLSDIEALLHRIPTLGHLS